MKVLIVSEDPRALDFARASVGPDVGYAMARNGVEAVRVAEEESFDVVIADETTEPYGAFGLSRELKMLPEAPRVILLLERSQDTWLARWSGADRWFVRPVDPFELGEAVRARAPKTTSGGAP
jgi:DNA-binding response OmpR family regulator